MRKIFLFIFISLSSFFRLSGASEELINIDFTRDSIEWKSQFPEPSWNITNTDFFVTVSDVRIKGCLFKGTFGKFNPGTTVKAQPIYNEDVTKNRRWAFRIDRTNESDSYFELPELPSVGKFTIYCKNSSYSTESVYYIQKKQLDNWVTIKTMYVPPHYDQDFEMQMEEYLNINSSVTLRISGATKNVHVYAVKVNAYNSSEPKEKPLRLVLLPDPQNYASSKALNPIYGIQTKWIANHSDSTMFVLMQGDLTQTNDDAQWSIAAGALTVIDGKKVPYTFVPGNHDMGDLGKTIERVTYRMNKYLPYSRYSRNISFGGTFEENTMDNTWHTFSKGDYKFLVLSLEFGPRNKVLEWAKTIIEQHPKYNVIINTHAYMYDDDLRMGEISTHKWLPQSYGIGNATGEDAVNNGQQIWDKLVKLYPNCLFVFSGHVLGRGIGHQVSEGVQGNKVYQFLANYQGGVDGTQEERNGMLRIVDLDPDNHSFSIKTYSPYTNRYNTDEGQHFFYDNVQYIKDEVSNISNPQSGKIKLETEGRNLKILNESGDKVTAYVYNLQGIKIIQRSGIGFCPILLPNPGCYIVYIQEGNSTVVRKKIIVP